MREMMSGEDGVTLEGVAAAIGSLLGAVWMSGALGKWGRWSRRDGEE